MVFDHALKTKAMSVENHLIVTLKSCCVCWTVATDRRESLLPAEGFWVGSPLTGELLRRKKNWGADQFWASFDIVRVCPRL